MIKCTDPFGGCRVSCCQRYGGKVLKAYVTLRFSLLSFVAGVVCGFSMNAIVRCRALDVHRNSRRTEQFTALNLALRLDAFELFVVLFYESQQSRGVSNREIRKELIG